MMRSSALAMGLVLVGCQDRPVECVDVSPIPPPPMPLTFEAWCEATYELEPAQNARCKGGTEAEWRLRSPTPGARCGWAEEVDPDVVFDVAAAERCLAEMAAHPCGGGVCDSVLVPRRVHAEGQACARGACLDGLRCEYRDTADQCPICVPSPERDIGAWCDLDRPCDFGDCVGNVCTEILHEAGTCREPGPPCGPGLFCSAGACRPLLVEGDSCDLYGRRSDNCGPDLGCDPIDLVCRRPECSRGRVGDDCDLEKPECLDGLHCSLEEVCALPPIVGEACGLIGKEEVHCVRSYCDARKSAQGHCQPRLEDGAPCTEPDQCESYHCALGTCRPYPQAPPPPPEMCSD